MSARKKIRSKAKFKKCRGKIRNRHRRGISAARWAQMLWESFPAANGG
jgi:hypothetical protein